MGREWFEKWYNENPLQLTNTNIKDEFYWSREQYKNELKEYVFKACQAALNSQSQEAVAMRYRYADNPYKWHHNGLNDTVSLGFIESQLLYTHPSTYAKDAGKPSDNIQFYTNEQMLEDLDKAM